MVLFDPARTGTADSTQAAIDQARPYVPPDLPQAPAQTPATPAAATTLTAAAPQAPRRSAGIGIVLAGLGAGAGAYFGGAYGAGAGLLLVGAGRNILRAKRTWGSSDHSEAVKSGTMALFGLGIGGWLAYKAWEGREHE